MGDSDRKTFGGIILAFAFSCLGGMVMLGASTAVIVFVLKLLGVI